MTRCGYCGYKFSETEAVPACRGCPLAGGCRLVRCPRCGYEMPPEPKLLTWLRRLRQGQKPVETTTKRSEESL